MIHKEVKMVQTVVVQRVECDKCGKEDTRAKTYDSFEFDFKLKTGTYDGWGGEYDQRQVKMDLCQTCAEELVTMLKSAGYRPQDSSEE